MKKIIFIFSAIIAVAILFYPQNTISLSTGSPGGKTGSPTDNADCMQCHSVLATTSTLTTITSNIPFSGYVPGATYTITANINPSSSLSGFEITCEENTSNTKTGALFITNSTETQLVNNGNSVTHTTAGNSATTWSFDWEAPIVGTGNITFYGAFIEAGYPFGQNFSDYFSSTTLSVNEFIPPPLSYVPDDNFENYLEANGMGDGVALNDLVLTSNINTVTYLNVFGQNINDLTGIEDFSSLDSLHCQNNQLTSINVSANTALAQLACSNNQITTLDVSTNTALVDLRCHSNQLTSLDVSNNTDLQKLHCWNNQLTSIDVTQNTALTELSCSSNQLTSADLSQNTALTSLYCSLNQFTSLDVSANTVLNNLYCNNNQLTNLDVSANTALTNLNCGGNQLTSLDVRNSNNTVLTTFSSTNNTNLYCIDVDNPTWSSTNWTNIDAWSVFSTNCSGTYGCTDSLACNYDSLATIDNSSCLTDYGCTDLLALNYDPIATCEDGSCIYEMTFVPDSAFEAYLESNGMGNNIINDNHVLTININTVITLSISSLNILDLTGIEDFASLNSLYCDNNQITTLDLSQNTNLTILDCYENQLTTLDVSGNGFLTNLNCRYNQLDTIDISNNTYLTYLDCSTNNIDNLNTTNNPELIYLYCRDNQLTNLNTSFNPNLLRLFCDENQITQLDVTNNLNLTQIECYSNQLTTLDLRENDSLTSLWCYSNQLTNLDLRNGNNTSITNFSSTNNPNLYCVSVDDTAYSSVNWINIDPWSSFSLNCVIEGCTDSLLVTEVIVDTTNLTMNIAIYNGYNYFLNYPYVALTIDANGDTIQSGNINLFGALNLDTSWYNYSIDSSITLSYPLTMYFVYSGTSFSVDTCILTYDRTVTGFDEINVRGKRNLVRIIDILGREGGEKKNTPLFYIYDDGTIEKRIIIE